jgi:hypothetical protein
MKRRELLSKMAVMTSGSVLLSKAHYLPDEPERLLKPDGSEQLFSYEGMIMRDLKIQKGNKLQETHADIWPMTWVGDVTYAAGNDSLGCPSMLYARKGRNVIFTMVRGTPGNCQVYTVNPMEQLGHLGEYKNGVGSWKASGLVYIDKVLYLMLFTHEYPAYRKAFPWWTAYRPSIIKSEDLGATWSTVINEPMFDNKFGNPSFVQFGRENENAPEGYVYAISSGEGQWVNNSTCILGRVKKENIMEGGSWEYYCGLSNGQSAWGKLNDAVPVVEKKDSIGCAPEVVYNSNIKKFIMMTFSAPHIKKTYTIDESWAAFPTPVDYDHAKGTLFHVFAADNVWGPWENVYEGESTGICDYAPRMPLMWLKHGSEESAYLVSSGDAWQMPDSTEHYGFVISRMTWKK